jgi:hypothetical protein
MRTYALLFALVVTLAVVARAGAAKPTIPGTSGTVWAVERFDGGVNTLAGFDAGTGDVLGVVDNDSGQILNIWPYPGGPWPHGVFYEPQVLR